MEEDSSSWLRRAKFSHTVCHRLDYSRLSSTPFSVEFDHVLELKPKSTNRNSSKLASTSLPLDRVERPNINNTRARSFNILPALSSAVPDTDRKFHPRSPARGN